MKRVFCILALLALFGASCGTYAIGQELLYSFEDDEEDWLPSGEDIEAEVMVATGVGNTEGQNSLQVTGSTGDYVRSAEVTLDFDRVELMNDGVNEEWNLEFDWTIVASENPGASRFWMQFATNHSAGWSQLDMFDNLGWQEWDPAGPEVQTMTASIPLVDLGNQDLEMGYCCGAVPDGLATSFSFHIAVGGAGEVVDGLRTYYLDNFRLVEPGAGIVGDFNMNGILDAPDIDMLTAASAGGQNPAEFDLNADALVNGADVVVWAHELKNIWIGDADVSGEFNSSDLVQVLAAGTFDQDVDAVWTQGDFTGDGRFKSGDLVAALADGGFDAGPRTATAAVPEPSALVLLVLGGLCLLRRR